MRRIEIPEGELRRLLADYSFRDIAARYGCNARAVSGLAARYGLSSIFRGNGPTAEEAARIKEMNAQGASLKEMAQAIGRSHTFITRHLHGPAPTPGAARGRPSVKEWRPESTASEALAGRTYEDVDERLLCRECPPQRPILNGDALAAAARASRLSFAYSTAALCASEGTRDTNDEPDEDGDRDDDSGAPIHDSTARTP